MISLLRGMNHLMMVVRGEPHWPLSWMQYWILVWLMIWLRNNWINTVQLRRSWGECMPICRLKLGTQLRMRILMIFRNTKWNIWNTKAGRVNLMRLSSCCSRISWRLMCWRKRGMICSCMDSMLLVPDLGKYINCWLMGVMLNWSWWIQWIHSVRASVSQYVLRISHGNRCPNYLEVRRHCPHYHSYLHYTISNQLHSISLMRLMQHWIIRMYPLLLTSSKKGLRMHSSLSSVSGTTCLIWLINWYWRILM